MALESLGKLLIIIGVSVVMVGAFFMLLSKLPWFGRLPGDIVVNRGGWSIYIPITTMILVSLVLTIIMNFIFRR
jgi:Zn-dependent protease with chaperone function